MEHRLRDKGGPTSLLGFLGPHPWLFEAAGQQHNAHAGPLPGCLRFFWQAEPQHITRPALAKGGTYKNTQGYRRQGKGCVQRTTPQGLSCQQATCTLQVRGTSRGRARALEPRREFSHHRTAFVLQTAQAPREGQQCVRHRRRGKSGPAGLLESLGPHPWLFEAAGQQDNRPRWYATGVAGSGVLGSPTLAVWRMRSQGRAHVDSISCLDPLSGCL